MDNPTIELVMSEFGGVRQNAGGGLLSASDRLNPTLDSFRRIFPQAEVALYTDHDLDAENDVKIMRVDPPFVRNEPRYGWRSHDYYQAAGLLQSSADIAIAMDSDMQIVSSGFRAIVELANTFGFAAPLNPRLLLKIDGGIGLDSTYEAGTDDTLGLGMTYNLTPMAFSTKHEGARVLLERYCQLLIQSPGRGAVHLVKATYELGYHPCVLPPQWCVCSPRDLDSKYLWKHAIALHVGHRDVLPRWRREMFKDRLRHVFRKLRGK